MHLFALFLSLQIMLALPDVIFRLSIEKLLDVPLVG